MSGRLTFLQSYLTRKTQTGFYFFGRIPMEGYKIVDQRMVTIDLEMRYREVQAVGPAVDLSSGERATSRSGIALCNQVLCRSSYTRSRCLPKTYKQRWTSMNDDDLKKSSVGVLRCRHLTACDSFVSWEDLGLIRLGFISQQSAYQILDRSPIAESPSTSRIDWDLCVRSIPL